MILSLLIIIPSLPENNNNTLNDALNEKKIERN